MSVGNLAASESEESFKQCALSVVLAMRFQHV